MPNHRNQDFLVTANKISHCLPQPQIIKKKKKKRKEEILDSPRVPHPEIKLVQADAKEFKTPYN